MSYDLNHFSINADLDKVIFISLCEAVCAICVSLWTVLFQLLSTVFDQF